MKNCIWIEWKLGNLSFSKMTKKLYSLSSPPSPKLLKDTLKDTEIGCFQRPKSSWQKTGYPLTSLKTERSIMLIFWCWTKKEKRLFSNKKEKIDKKSKEDYRTNRWSIPTVQRGKATDLLEICSNKGTVTKNFTNLVRTWIKPRKTNRLMKLKKRSGRTNWLSSRISNRNRTFWTNWARNRPTYRTTTRQCIECKRQENQNKALLDRANKTTAPCSTSMWSWKAVNQSRFQSTKTTLWSQ